MQRRQFLAASISVAAISLAGCVSLGPSPVVHEYVVDHGMYEFYAEADDTIRIEVENREGARTIVALDSPSEMDVVLEHVETEEEFTYDADEGGVYTLFVMNGGSSRVRVYLN